MPIQQGITLCKYMLFIAELHLDKHANEWNSLLEDKGFSFVHCKKKC